MLIRELTTDQCFDLLERSNLGRLACARDGQPYIVPVNYSFDRVRKCLYVFSTIGQKVAWMRENPKVCVEVDEVRDKDHWTTVVIFGRYEEITDGDTDARKRAQDLFQHRVEWWFPAAGKLPEKEAEAVVLYRIVIDRLSGRHASRGTKA